MGNQRTYIISYYTEKNDECVDLEYEVEAPDVIIAAINFRAKVKVFKRIFKIEEK